MTRWNDFPEIIQTGIANTVLVECEKLAPLTVDQQTALTSVWSGVMDDFKVGGVRCLYDAEDTPGEGTTIYSAVAMAGAMFHPALSATLNSVTPTDSLFVPVGWGSKETGGNTARSGTEQVAIDDTVESPDPLDLKVPDIRTKTMTDHSVTREDQNEKFRFLASGGKTLVEIFHRWVERLSEPSDL